jgi:hypothetical protein
VLRVHAPDPYRPRVRILFGRDRNRLELPVDLNLWEADRQPDRASSIAAPLDPAEHHIDPLNYM